MLSAVSYVRNRTFSSLLQIALMTAQVSKRQISIAKFKKQQYRAKNFFAKAINNKKAIVSKLIWLIGAERLLLNQMLIVIILGIIQGISEWLPISSTAHLKISEYFLGFQATPLFNVFLHIGTLSVVIFYFRREIKTILTDLFRGDFHSEYGRFIPLIIIASTPTGIIGILYDLYLGDNYQTFLIMGITFLVGATLLFFSKYGKENQNQISYREALVMGTAQGSASFRGCQEVDQRFPVG